MDENAWLAALICPVCGAALTRGSGRFACAQGHAFDIAREGYVNLLSGVRRPPLAGDARPMLQARRRLLERGIYRPLSDAVSALVAAHLDGLGRTAGYGGDVPRVLDAGCGEGYYLGELGRRLRQRPDGGAVGLCGVDIAKDAIKLAARRQRDALFLVADATGRLPLAAGSADALLNIFAPRNPAEFDRALAPAGLLLVVIPGPGHLAELRAALGLLDIEANKEHRVAERFAGRFAPAAAETLAYDLELDREGVRDLVLMGPNYRHLSDRTRAALDRLDRFRTRAEFVVMRFRKAGGGADGRVGGLPQGDRPGRP